MDKTLNKIVNEAVGIMCSLNRIDGQMTFFSRFIDDCENHREGMASMMKNGEAQKQLHAIYALIINELENIHKANEDILKVEEKEFK